MNQIVKSTSISTKYIHPKPTGEQLTCTVWGYYLQSWKQMNKEDVAESSVLSLL